jgi:glycosyltransferase involved in cell wall biosynthesis
MKILRIISSMDPKLGGPSQGIRNSIPALSSLGITNEVVCLDDLQDTFIGKDSFPVHAIGKAKGFWAYNEQLTPWLLENFQRFDAVIIHGLWLYHGYAAHKAWKEYKKVNKNAPKMYVMPHGMLDPWFQHAKGRRLKAIRNWFYWKAIEQYVVNEADGVLFTCEEELKLARGTFTPYHPRKELNIGYGIITPPAFTVQMKEAFLKLCPEVENEPYLLFLSRINVKKGVDLLINAYLKLKKSGQRLPKLVIAGPGGDSAYGRQMRELAAADKDILFLGMVSGPAKWGAFYGCEAFVLPSHQENFGISVVEALACGKPVLISDQVNIWREIEKERAGLVANDTAIGVLKQIEKWLSFSKPEKKRMSGLAKETFLKYYKMEVASLRIKDALENIELTKVPL